MRLPSRVFTGLAAVAVSLTPAVLAMEVGGPRASLRLIYTGNLRGVLEPCGCQQLQPGGLSRRAALLRRLRVPGTPALLVDVGDNLPPGQPRREMMTFVYGIFKRLGYDAVNLGPFDLELPEAEIADSARQAGVALVGGRLAGSVPRPAPMFRLLRAGGVRVGLIGAPSAPTEAPSEEAIAAIRSAARRLRASADVVVVLSQLPPEEVLRCSSAVPEVDLFVSGRHDSDLAPQVQNLHGRIVACPGFGQAIGVAEIRLGAHRAVQSVNVRYERIDPQIPRDPEIKAAVEAFYQQHSQVLGTDGGRREETGRVFAALLGRGGTDGVGCEGCHKQEYNAWRATRHARAWRTLVDNAAATRADCVGCHSVAEPAASSFSPLMTGVGCAACHGSDPDHARHPENPRFIVRRPPEAVCRGCHTPLQSPGFSYPLWLARVAHAIVEDGRSGPAGR